MMQDYIRMTALRHWREEYDLVSEPFVEKEEADHFAKCFAHNYNCEAVVRRAAGEGEYVVFAYNVEERLIRVNMSDKSGNGEFANWKFEGRKFD